MLTNGLAFDDIISVQLRKGCGARLSNKEINAAERRLDIVLYLSQKREVHYRELMNKYNVSAPVIRKDLNYIEEILRIPIITKKGRTGSVRIANSRWNMYQKHLNINQETVIKKAIALLSSTDRNIMQSVLDDFAPQ